MKPKGRVNQWREAVASWRVAPRAFRARSNRGPSEVTLFCFGQSHSVCLRHAWERGLYRPDNEALDFKFILASRKAFPGDAIVVQLPESGADAIHPELERAFVEHAVLSGSTEAWLVSVVRGNAYNVYGLFEPDPPFDFVHPDMPDLPVRPDAQLLPYDAIKAMFIQSAESTRRFFKSLPRQNIAGILHMEAPPPIPSQAQCHRSIERVLLQRVLRRSWGVPISAREFRMKLWKCQSDVNREICSATNVIYVTPPEEALDQHGYLLPEGWSGATHASPWYGALALRKIEAVITGERRPQ